jgi:hypothetical protein
LSFLRRIDREFPGKTALHLIMDNYGTHGHADVKAWLTKHPRYVIHYVPTSCSWLTDRTLVCRAHQQTHPPWLLS